jgi:hypothetical protein
MTKPTPIQTLQIDDHWTYHVKPIIDKVGNMIADTKSVQQWINDMTKVEDFDEMDTWVEKNLLQLLDLAQWDSTHHTESPIKGKDEEDETTCL